MIWIFVVLLFLIPLYKWLANRHYFNGLNKLYKRYDSYIRNGIKSDPTIVETKQEIIQLFKRAGVKPFIAQKLIGCVVHNVNTFDNLFVIDPYISGLVYQSFTIALGEYKHRMSQAFDPFYWIETIIHLPSKFFDLAFNLLKKSIR